MKKIETNEKYALAHSRRFQKTLAFLEENISKNDKILDLGPSNPLSKLISDQGYEIANTSENQDLDLDFHDVKNEKYTVVTAFEILEHMVSPFPLLKEIKAKKLFISVPLKLWFASAYWSEKDPYDRHYHEFEPRQLEMLLNKAGWQIKKSDKWYSTTTPLIGIRPLLRRFYPRYYIVYCERLERGN